MLRVNLNLLMLYGMAKKLTKQMAAVIAEFVDELGLVPKSLITREVIELIHQSWQREFQQQQLNELEKQAQRDYLLKLRERSKKRLPQKVLNNMQPININPLLDV